MKKNKGFTLVELLAVIAILAILVIMALPAVLRMYRQSRINTFQNETRSVYRTAQSQFLGDSMLLGSGQKILYTNGCNSSSEADVVKSLDMTGNSNFKYYVLIDVDGKVLEVRSSNGTYSYSKTGSDLKVEDMDVETYNDSELDSDISSTICTASGGSGSSGSSSGSSSSATNIATVVEGQSCSKTTPECEVTIAGENFYVVSSDSTNTVLLAKYDLKSDGSGSYTQDTSGTSTNIVKATFLNSSSLAYWDGCLYSVSTYDCTSSPSGLISPYSDGGKAYCISSSGTNCAYVYDNNAVNIEPVVRAYANKIGTAAGTIVTGKLLSLEQANGLTTNVRKDMNGIFYWLGSACSFNYIWFVHAGGIIEVGIDSNQTGGVRPVIIIPTSAL